MECYRCMTENPSDARQCIRCGMHLGGATAHAPPKIRRARRGSRLLARVIDLPFSLYSVLVAMNLSASLPGGDAIPTSMILLAAFTVPVQIWLLATQGQTIGKRLMRLRIVRNDDEKNGGFMTNVLLRTLVSEFLWVIPGYVAVDILFIYSRNRRCVHDYIAGTRVVRDEFAADWRELLRSVGDRLSEMAYPGRRPK